MNPTNNDKVIKDMVAVGEIISNNRNSSITKLTKNLIFGFPVIMSNTIPYDDAYPIVKSIEKNFAAMYFSAISAEGFVDRNRYKTIGDFLKYFHNNVDLPMDAIEQITPNMEDEWEASAVVCEGFMAPERLAALNDSTRDMVNTKSLNDIHRPYNITKNKLQSVVENAKAVMEANEPKYYRYPKYKTNDDGSFVTDPSDNSNKTKVVMTDPKTGNTIYEYVEVGNDKHQKMQESKYGAPQTMKDWNAQDMAKQHNDLSGTKTDAMVLPDNAFGAMGPTVLKFTLANKEKGTNPWSHTFAIGIKSTPRILKSSLMVSNMVEAYKNRPIFSFLDMITAEKRVLNFFDELLGWSSSREYVKSGSKWVKVLANHAKQRKIPFLGKNRHPITTIIITDAEAYEIKQRLNIDPNNAAHTKKMMASHNILCFCIYDAEEKMLRMMYDGESSFTDVSLRTLIADINKQLTIESK